jgi:Orf78 (ac78)
MSLDVPYERLNATAHIDYIPLKLALNDLPDQNATSVAEPKIDINVPPTDNNVLMNNAAPQKQMYDALVLGMLSVFCILVLLYAIYYFVILRGRQKPPLRQSSYMY